MEINNSKEPLVSGINGILSILSIDIDTNNTQNTTNSKYQGSILKEMRWLKVLIFLLTALVIAAGFIVFIMEEVAHN